MRCKQMLSLSVVTVLLAASLAGCGTSSNAPSAVSSEAPSSAASSAASEVTETAALPDGVYTADPRKDENAKRFATLSYNRALVDNLAVMDAAALSMARDNKQRIRVFGLEGAGNVTQALLGEEIGTMVSTAESTLAE